MSGLSARTGANTHGGSHSDPTMEFLRKLDQPQHWHVKRNVPIFVPHTRKVMEDGKARVLYQITEADLHRIVAVYKRQFSKVGVPPRITIGHTQREKPESAQPELVGFAQNLRVGRWGPERKLGILCDEYLFPHRAMYALCNFPYRSVEYYPGREEIAGVSLLIRDPELDLGIVMAGRDEVTVLYQRGGGRNLPRPSSNDLLVIYQREVNMPDLEQNPVVPPVAENPDEPTGDELTPDEAGTADRYMRHYERNHPVMKHLCQKYGAEAGAAPAMPGATNGALPEPMKPKPEEEAPLPFARAEDAARYARAEAERKQLARNLIELNGEVLKMKREKDLVGLERQGIVLNVAEELKDALEMTPEQYARHLKRIQTKYERDPAAGGMVRIAGDGQEGGGDGRMSNARLAQCLAYQRDHGCTWEEAEAKCS